MRNAIIYYVAFFGFVIFFSCEESQPTCTYAQRIAVESGCYDPARGLRLVALGAGTDSTNLSWEIHVLEDLANGWSPDDILMEGSGIEIFTIPDTVLLDYIHVLARVTTDCDGTSLHSKYFSFVKIRSTNCTIWTESEI